MNTKSELKNIGIKALKKWLFPDFSNKITWLVLTAGLSIILVPESFKLAALNWLVESINLNSGIQYTLPEIKSDKTDHYIGVFLVVISLAYSLCSKYILQTENGVHNPDLIPSGDWTTVKQDILTNLKSDRDKLNILIPKLGDASHDKPIDEIYQLDSSWTSLQDRRTHLQSTPRSKIENKNEMDLIGNWYQLKRKVNKNMSMVRRVEFINENEKSIRDSLDQLILFYENA